MRWKAKYTKADYANGTQRFKRIFSWLPTYINGQIVWLETYEVLQLYIIKEYSTDIEGKKVFFHKGRWENISKRIIE